MKQFAIFIPMLALTACAKDPKFLTEQDKLYQTSMAQYQDYNCSQVKAEMFRVSNLIERQTNLLQKPEKDKNQYLDTAVSVFAIARGINPSQDTSEERMVLARLKSQYNGLDQLFIRKNCVMSDGQ